MSEQGIIYLMMIAGGLFLAVVVAYLIINKNANKKENRYIRQLREGTSQKKFSADILYQKFYVIFLTIKFKN